MVLDALRLTVVYSNLSSLTLTLVIRRDIIDHGIDFCVAMSLFVDFKCITYFYRISNQTPRIEIPRGGVTLMQSVIRNIFAIVGAGPPNYSRKGNQ